MKENIGDAILARVEKRITDVSENLSKRFKNVKPFDSVKMKPEEQVWWFDQLTPQDMNMLIQKHGPEKVNALIQGLEGLRLNRGMGNDNKSILGA